MKTQAWPRTLPLFLVWLSYAFVPEAIGQPWHSADAIPVFRGTEAQDRARRKVVNSLGCRANLRMLWRAAQLYALDNADRLPPQWSDFTNRITRPSVLSCPADVWHPAQSDWDSVNLAELSYEMLAPGARMGDASRTWFRCRVHGHTVRTRGVPIEARPYDGRGFPITSTNGIRMPLTASLAQREETGSYRCVENLHTLGTAARLFAGDHADVMPSSFAEIAEALDSPEVLVCPSDLLRTAAGSLAELNTSNITYHIDAPGISANVNPSQRFITCPIHGHQYDTHGMVVEGTSRYPPRLIIGHPLSYTVEPGRPVELAVLTGDANLGPFRYQWRRLQPFDAAGEPLTNTMVVVDATNRTYHIPAADAADEGYYDVIVTDAQGGYQLSHLAYLRVEPLTSLANPGLDWEAAACFINLNQIGRAARMFFARANHDQWPQSYSNLTAYLGWPLTVCCPSDPGRPAPDAWEAVDFANLSYTLETGLPMDPGTNVLASCKVHRFWVQSDGKTKVGEVPPAMVVHPSSQTTFTGRPVSLGVWAIGDSPSYQWYRNAEAVTGETNSTLRLPGPSVTNTSSYYALVSNPWGSATSHVAVVTVNPIPNPRLQWTVTSPGVEFALSLAGPAGVECRLEASPDLNSWTTLTTNVLTEGVFVFLQRMDALRAARFYRATLR